MKLGFGWVAMAGMLAVATVPDSASADETVCQGTISARRTLDNIRVPPRASCVLRGTHAKGTVKVEEGARLDARGVRIDGNVQAEGARRVVVSGRSSVGGSIQIVRGGSAEVSGSSVKGDLFLDSNATGVAARDNRIEGSLQAFQNSGGVRLNGNLMKGNLQCKENRPAPVGGGNQAANKEDQCKFL